MILRRSLKWLQPVQAIAISTGREILRDRVLLNLGAVGLLLVVGALFASQLSLRAEGRVLLDFGVFGFSFSLGMLGVFFGASVFAREIERRTFHMTLSRPVTRLQFVSGKFLGLAGVMAINACCLVLLLLVIFALTIGGLSHPLLGKTLFFAFLLEFLQALTLLGLALFFSSFSTTSLSVVMTLGCFIVGANLSQLRWLAVQPEIRETFLERVLEWVSSVLPNFELFDVDSWVSYGLPLPPELPAYAVVYALALISASLVGASLALQGRENA